MLLPLRSWRIFCAVRSSVRYMSRCSGESCSGWSVRASAAAISSSVRPAALAASLRTHSRSEVSNTLVISPELEL